MKIFYILQLLFCATTIFAQTNFTAISNTNQPTSGDYSVVEEGYSFAISFVTSNATTALLAVSIPIVGSVPGPGCPPFGTLGVAIYRNAGGSPGSSLEVLSGNGTPTNSGIYTYTNGAGGLELSANTTYWIVVTNSDTSSGSAYKWSETPINGLDAGSTWKLGVSQSAHNGGGWLGVGPYFFLFSVTATTALPVAPTLSASLSVVLTFPATAAPFVLQQNSDLATTNWVTVTNFIFSDILSNQAVYILPPTAPQKYYRMSFTP